MQKQEKIKLWNTTDKAWGGQLNLRRLLNCWILQTGSAMNISNSCWRQNMHCEKEKFILNQDFVQSSRPSGKLRKYQII